MDAHEHTPATKVRKIPQWVWKKALPWVVFAGLVFADLRFTHH
jgi:hypothetical protein